jgi:glucokinase
MHVIGLDLGGTKLAAAIFSENGQILKSHKVPLEKKSGFEVGTLIVNNLEQLLKYANQENLDITGIGVSVPGIYYANSGQVWAPNITGWDHYPLLEELSGMPELANKSIKIDSDRACYILGETWLGSAKANKNAIFLAIGTGIGAGILIDGKILRGHGDIAGAIGWLGLDRPFNEKYQSCGGFEYYASGDGLARYARELILKNPDYAGELLKGPDYIITSHDVFDAYQSNDLIATEVINNAISLWGMAVANLVSIFNPEKIILGGGVFGPAAKFLKQINEEACLWAQPISMKQVKICVSSIGDDAGLIGAARLALLKD